MEMGSSLKILIRSEDVSGALLFPHLKFNKPKVHVFSRFGGLPRLLPTLGYRGYLLKLTPLQFHDGTISKGPM